MENVCTSLRNEVTRSMYTVHITQGLMVIVHSAVGLPVVVVLWFPSRNVQVQSAMYNVQCAICNTQIVGRGACKVQC